MALLALWGAWRGFRVGIRLRVRITVRRVEDRDDAVHDVESEIREAFEPSRGMVVA